MATKDPRKTGASQGEVVRKIRAGQLTVNQVLRDQSLRHQVGLDRVAGGIRNEVLKLLDDGLMDVRRQLNETIPGIDPDSFRGRKLRQLERRLETAIKNAYDDAIGGLKNNVETLVNDEVKYQRDMLKRAIPIDFDVRMPSGAQLESLVRTRPFEGKVLSDWSNSLSGKLVEETKREIQLGFMEGQSNQEIVSRVTGTRAQSFRNGVLEKGRRRAAAITRTAVTEFAQGSSELIYKRNRNIVKAVKYTATLDDRTTVICAEKDGQVFKIGEGPRPPLHHRCRSTTTPVTKSWREMGLNRDELSPGQRAAMDGEVPADTTFDQWLQGQATKVQKNVLGKSRMKLWREGNLDLGDFVSTDNRVLTLDELRMQESAAFEAAGL